jgi:hypothetical protein
MMDVGAVEQRTDRRNQHDIVGPNQFTQLLFSFVDPASARHEASQPLHALAAFPGTFYCYASG